MSVDKGVIVGYDLVTAYGWGVDPTWRGLLSGVSSIGRCDRFQTKAFATSNAATIAEVDDSSEDSLALQMCLPLLERVRADVAPDTLVILGTTVGEIDYLSKSLQNGSRPGGPQESCPDRLLRKVESVLGVSSHGVVVSAACASSSAAIAEAASLIRLRQRDSVLILGCDVVSEFVFSGFSALSALDPEAAKPFDKNKGGLTLGEGAGYVLLMSEERALREDRPILGEIAGWGLSSDACHMTAPSRDGTGLAEAIAKALRSAGINADDVACVSAHGTGTVYNDAMEMAALRIAFPLRPLPTYSVKGAVGHTLGAAGIVDMIVAAETLRHNAVPPTVGLNEVDSAASGWASTVAQTFEGAVTVSTNAGFGGINTALVLKDHAMTKSRARIRQRATGPGEADTGVENGADFVLTGFGWIVGGEWGTGREPRLGSYGSLSSLHAKLKRHSASPNPIRDFGRFDDASKLTCCALALALEDDEAACGEQSQKALGIVGTDAHGALRSNVHYFEDYLENGRTLARGNLFVYTLASSPLTAAAIHFGCRGPVLHVTPSVADAAAPLRTAERLMLNHEAQRMLVLWRTGEDALCIVLHRAGHKPAASAAEDSGIRGLADLLSLAGAATSVAELVRGLLAAPSAPPPFKGAI